MVDRATQGPAQIFNLDVASINYALRDLSERVDELSGLRGRAMIYDRVRIDSPIEATDAVDLQSLLDQESRTRILFIPPPGNVALLPGITYAEIDAAYRHPFDFANLSDPEARVIVRGWGTEDVTDKGVSLHDGTSVLAEVTWDGNIESLYVGDFTSIALTTDTTLQLHVKGGSATESLILRTVVVEVSVTIRVIAE